MKRQREGYSSDDELGKEPHRKRRRNDEEDLFADGVGYLDDEEANKSDIMRFRESFLETVTDISSNATTQVGFTDLNHASVKKITEILRHNTSVSAIRLPMCDLRAAGITGLLELANVKPNIKLLEISHQSPPLEETNDIDDDAAQSISDLINSNTTLQQFSLQDADAIWLDGISVLFNAIRNHRSLVLFSIISTSLINLTREDVDDESLTDDNSEYEDNELPSLACDVLSDNRNLISFCDMPLRLCLTEDLGDQFLSEREIRLHAFCSALSNSSFNNTKSMMSILSEKIAGTAYAVQLNDALQENDAPILGVVLYNHCKAHQYASVLAGCIENKASNYPLNLHFYMGLMERQACVPYLMNAEYNIKYCDAYLYRLDVLSRLCSNLFELMGVTKSCMTQGGVDFNGILIPNDLCKEILQYLQPHDLATMLSNASRSI